MNKAMISAITIIIVMMLVVLSAMFIVSGWEIPWPNGNGNGDGLSGGWKTQIKVVYKDGTTDSFPKLLTLYVKDSPVATITYHLQARATGEGYNTVIYDLSNCNVFFMIYEGIWNDPTGSPANIVSTGVGMEVTKPVDGQWYIVGEPTITGEQLAPATLAPGDYTLKFQFFAETTSGVPYKGDGDTEWSYTTNLPVSIIYHCEIRDDKTLVVDFRGATTTSSG
jgi:hypothetical protein